MQARRVPTRFSRPERRARTHACDEEDGVCLNYIVWSLETALKLPSDFHRGPQLCRLQPEELGGVAFRASINTSPPPHQRPSLWPYSLWEEEEVLDGQLPGPPG